MTKMTLKTIDRFYKNNGQHAEQVARFTITGEICKADNKPFTAGGDCGNLQIKSAKATICKGTDIAAHLRADKAELYGYVVADFSEMFVMTKAEYFEFAKMFSTITRESSKNGGAEKMRFKSESKKVIEYLQARV